MASPNKDASPINTNKMVQLKGRGTVETTKAYALRRLLGGAPY